MARLARAAAILLFAGAAGCTVSLGSPPDASPCRPSTAFFGSTLWPNFILQNSCVGSECHAFDGGHGYLRLKPGGSETQSGPYADWPAAWQYNYEQSILLFDCQAPLASRLLTVPEGLADPHQRGDQIEDHPDAELLFQEWATAP